MNKKTLIAILITLSVILLALLGVWVYFTVSEHVGGEKYNVADTLPDGEGRPARVILLAGQSNMSGCSLDEYLKKNVSAEKYAEYDAGYDNIYINVYSSEKNRSDAFVKCATRQGEINGHFGPELGIAEKLHELYPDETIFLIKHAWGGTNLYEQWLSPSSPGQAGWLYKNFVNYVDASIDYLVKKNYAVKIEGLCWMQGESDSFSVEHATDYAMHLTNFIADIRTRYNRFASDDGIAFIDAYIADNPVFWVYCELVNKSKDTVAAAAPNNLLIDTIKEGLVTTEEPADNPDIPHYDSLSQIKLGHLFAEAVASFFDK